MIKNFEEFNSIKESVDTGKYGVSAKDLTSEQEYSINVLECTFKSTVPDFELAAAIYVMPDDTVEIRSIEKGKNVHGIIEGLTGDDVRQNDLHRNQWIIYYN